MRKFIAGLIIGLTIAFATMATANPGAIKLIINGQEIQTDVPPQNIEGRVMVPARFVAEPLGAKVEWDPVNNAVVITGNPAPEPVIIEEKREGEKSMSINEPPIKETTSPVKLTTYNGIAAIEVDGEIYYDRREQTEKYLERNPDAVTTSDENQITRTLNGETIIIPVNDENIKAYRGRSYVHIRFFE